MFKKIALFLPAVFLASFLFGQKKYQVEVVVGGGFSVPNSVEMPKIWQPHTQDASKIAATFGLRFISNLPKNWQARLGFEGSFLGFDAFCDCTQWGEEHDGNGGYLRKPELDNKFSNQTAVWEISLATRKNWERKNWLPFLEFGIGLGAVGWYKMMAYTSAAQYQYPKKIENTKIQVSLRPAIGMSKKIFGKKTLSFAAVSKVFLTEVKLENLDWKYRFFVPGLELGWSF